MKIKEFGVYFNSRKPLLFVNGFYGSYTLKVDGRSIETIFDFSILNPEQKRRLKKFWEKYKDSLPTELGNYI